MRYLEIVVAIAVQGSQSYELVESVLRDALGLYKTEDILLKMAMVQVIAGLGEGK